MLQCPVRPMGVYRSRVLAMRDMRTANGRDAESGDGEGNASWIGLALGMMVLDTLTPESEGVRDRWLRLLTGCGINDEDCAIIYQLRCSLLHGYGIPKPEKIGGRCLLLTNDHNAYAIDTNDHNVATVSVPVFCRSLVERIVAETPEQNWDTTLININVSR
jgi:hypothetical protein